MKNFVKFIPVALGLLTLASCSNDELLSEKAFDAVQLNEDEMAVDLEEASEYGDLFTRSYTDRTMKKHRWTESIDQLQVYGKAFGAYDLYAFSWKTSGSSTVGVFKRQHQMSNIDDPKWALFPLKNIVSGKWNMIDAYNNYTEVTVKLPKFIEYGAAYDAPNYATGADLDPYYLDELPRFGEVSEESSSEGLRTNLKYMTAVLRIQLAGIPNYANGIKIQMRENANPSQTLVINGNFTTRIGSNNRIVEGAALSCDKNVLNAGKDKPQFATNPDEDGAVYVHIPATTALNGIDAKKGVLYVPLPVWATESSIAIFVNDPATPYGGENPASGTKKYNQVTWKLYKELSKKPIERAKVYGNKNEYNLALDGTDPSAISDALELMEVPGDENECTLVANDEIEVCGSANATTIKIPNKKNANDQPVDVITIDLRNGLHACASNSAPLKFVYASDGDPFLGSVVLIADNQNASAANPVMLDVNLPKSGFAIVAGGDKFDKAIDQNVYTDKWALDIDAVEFAIGNDDKYTPTSVKAGTLKFSPNVATLTVNKEGELTGDFKIDQQTNPKPEDWTFGSITAINVKGVVNGAIDATTKTKNATQVNIKVTGAEIESHTIYDAPTVNGSINTRGTVTIENAGTYVSASSADNKTATFSAAITAEGAITATGGLVAMNANIKSEKDAVTLKGHTVASGNVDAEKDITIGEQAAVQGNITSAKGNIEIDNNYTEDTWITNNVSYTGAIVATKGSVSLNQAENKEQGKYLRVAYDGAITAGTDFTMTGLTTTSDAILLSGIATIDVAPQEGNCIAVSGSLTYRLGTAYKLNLYQGYVKGLNATAGPVELEFKDAPAYAALAGVTKYNNVKPKNVSQWNGDYKLAAILAADFAPYAFDGINHSEPSVAVEHNRIWTATQLGYMMTTPWSDIQLRSDIDLKNEKWPGIAATDATTLTGLIDQDQTDDYYKFKTISNLNLTNPSSQKNAGFFKTSNENLTVDNIHFDGVKTTFSQVSTAEIVSGTAPEVNMWGVGAVVGYAKKDVALTRVHVKLAGDSFGAKGTVNKRSAYIGGLVGRSIAASTFEGVEFDGNNVPLCGWYNIGGFIGRSGGAFKVKLADADGELEAEASTVKNLKVKVSFVNTADVNDLYQGMTGQLAGSVSSSVEIKDFDDNLVNAKYEPEGAKDSGMTPETNKAFKITVSGSNYNRHFFNRVDQTLIGHDGTYEDNTNSYKINGEVYQIYKEGGTNYSPGNKHFYNLTIENHQN